MGCQSLCERVRNGAQRPNWLGLIGNPILALGLGLGLCLLPGVKQTLFAARMSACDPKRKFCQNTLIKTQIQTAQLIASSGSAFGVVFFSR
jgi:hypothetical protein